MTTRSTAVALIDCPECGRQISTAAEACPGCGHPNRPAAAVPTGPKCYACPAVATTKCQKCNAASCVAHVEGVTINLNGNSELRCTACVSDANGWKLFQGCLIVISLVIGLGAMLFAFSRR